MENPEPSLLRNQFEGATTRRYRLEQMMNFVQPSGSESFKSKRVIPYY